jgi:hypothetical protein
VSISASALAETAIAAQQPSGGTKKPTNRPPSNRQIVAKSDAVAQPEPR